MVVVSTAGAAGTGKTSLAAAITGKRPENPVSHRLAITNGKIGDTSFTLLDSPAFDLDLHDSLTGICLADILLISVNTSKGLGDEEKQLVELAAAFGKTTVAISLNQQDDALTAKAEELLRRNGISQGAVFTQETSLRGLTELLGSAKKHHTDHVRIWAQRIFRKPNVGTVVIGIVEAGPLKPSDILINPTNNRRSKIRALQVAGEGVEEAGPGSFVAINVADFDVHAVSPGSVLITDPQAPVTKVFECNASVLESSTSRLTPNHIYGIHFGSTTGYATLQVVSSAAIDRGNTGTIRIHVGKPLPLMNGDRMVLTDVETHRPVAVATVTSVSPHMDELESNSDEFSRSVVDIAALEQATARLRVLIASSGSAGLELGALSEHERAILLMMSGVEVVNGRAFIAGIEPDFDMRPARANSSIEL